MVLALNGQGHKCQSPSAGGSQVNQAANSGIAPDRPGGRGLPGSLKSDLLVRGENSFDQQIRYLLLPPSYYTHPLPGSHKVKWNGS